jgi:hypothetical protein
MVELRRLGAGLVGDQGSRRFMNTAIAVLQFKLSRTVPFHTERRLALSFR